MGRDGGPEVPAEHGARPNAAAGRGRSLDACAKDKTGSDWLFEAPRGGPLTAIGRPTLRLRDLRHTCAWLRLGAGADRKVVQRILGNASPG